jgi:hypothetical protein
MVSVLKSTIVQMQFRASLGTSEAGGSCRGSLSAIGSRASHGSFIVSPRWVLWKVLFSEGSQRCRLPCEEEEAVP